MIALYIHVGLYAIMLIKRAACRVLLLLVAYASTYIYKLYLCVKQRTKRLWMPMYYVESMITASELCVF